MGEQLIYRVGRYDQEAADAQELANETERWLSVVANLEGLESETGA